MQRSLASTLLSAPLLATLLSVSGCGSDPGVETKRNGDAVWSDDAQEIAYAAHRDVSQGTGSTGGGTTFHWTLRTRAADGSGDHAAAAERTFQLLALYDMHRAGYLLFLEVDSANGSHTNLLRTGSSTVTSVGADVSCPRTSSSPAVRLSPIYLPSPDGAVLARMLTPADCADWNAGVTSVGVDLLDATSLSVKSSAKVTYAGTAIDWTWTPDGTFVFTDGLSNWGFVPTASGASSRSKPGCFKPQTSSSDVAADGRKIVVQDDGTQTVTPGGTPFGCQ
jgi:hypothetical protein